MIIRKGKVMMAKSYDRVKDSGRREEFGTGALRDTGEKKGYPSLIPAEPLRRLAKHYQNGADKYGKHNWMLGIPLSRYYDSLFRHLMAIRDGEDDEDHEAAVLWNMVSFMETRRLIDEGQLPKELDDMVYSVNDARKSVGTSNVEKIEELKAKEEETCACKCRGE